MTHCDIISSVAVKPLILSLKYHVVKFSNKYMSFENVCICISNHISRTDNNYKLLLNDQNEFGVLDMIEWKLKYTELIDNVYVLKDMIDTRDSFKECVGFSMEEVEAILCLN